MSRYNNVVQLVVPQERSGVSQLQANEGGQGSAQESGPNPQDEVERTNILVVCGEKSA